MPSPRQNYIYVDFENIQEVDINLIAQRPVKVVIALGKRQTNLPVGMVKDLLKYPDQVELIDVGVAGKNALDFVLAYYIGQQTLQDPTGYFHILSRDKGFDSLVEHLKSQKIFISRHDTFADIWVLKDERFLKSQPPAIPHEEASESKPPAIRIVKPPVSIKTLVPQPSEAKTAPRVVIKATSRSVNAAPVSQEKSDRLALLTENLAKNKKNRPARRSAFLSHVHHFFGNKLNEAEGEDVLRRLIADGVISVTPENQIVYRV